MKQTIFDFLYSDATGLPECYSEDEITMKSNLVFGHFLTQRNNIPWRSLRDNNIITTQDGLRAGNKT